MGTYGGGVSRFDGLAFTNFTTKDGLPSDVVYAITEDANGDLWFGTDEGVVRFDGAQFYPVEEGVEDRAVYAVMTDSQGRLWFGTGGNGLIRWDDATTTRFTRKDGLPDSTVRALYQDREGSVWVGTEGGLCRLQDSAFTCYTTLDGLGSDVVYSIVEDDKDRLWVGTHKGVSIYDGQGFVPASQQALKEARVQTMFTDSDGSVWVGTNQGLIRVFRTLVIAYNQEHGLTKSMIWSLHKDREGNLWIGSDDDGLSKLAPSPFVLFDARHGLAEDGVWTIQEDSNGHLWFGTNAHGLSRYDGSSFTTFTTADGLSDDRVYSSLMDREGTLWFGTPNGITTYDGERFTPLSDPRIEGEVWALAEDRQGVIWIALWGEGVFAYQDGALTKYTVEDGLAGTVVASIHADRQGVVWFGTDRGLTRYDGEAFTVFTEADGLGNKEVSYILDSPDGDLWVGTYGGGVSHYTPEVGEAAPVFRTFTQDDGLSNAHVLSMAFDEQGSLWICTNNGLNKLDGERYKTSGEVHVTQYGKDEGFVGLECNAGAAYRDHKNQLWFGTVKGVMRYTPGHGSAEVPEPRTRITNLRLFFEDQDWTPYADSIDAGTGLPATLTLPYNKNHLTFDFVGISLTAPERVSYQYQLEGFDETWMPVTQKTQATYANLPAGLYTFRVKAANSEGHWNTEAVSYEFVITPPFWRTPWFYLIGVLSCLLGVYGLVRIRERKLRQRQQLLEKKVEERTREMQRQKEKVVRVNEKLRHTNLELEQLSLVARETDNAVFIADAEGRIEWVNEGFTRMTGYTLETLIRDKGETVQAISSYLDIAEALRKAVQTHSSTIYEAKFCTLDGAERWLSSTLTPITDDADIVQKLVVIDTDITERKALEEELIAAREVALDAARAKSDFLANMSHEIRTPMNGVIGMTSLLLDTDLQPDQHEFVQVIRTSGDALMSIINDILDFSKIEVGKVELEEQAFDLHEVIEEALDLVATEAAGKALELAYFIEDPVPPRVRGDVTRVRQVLTNLPHQRRCPDEHHQRHPRLFQDRSRQGRARRASLRPARGHRRSPRSGGYRGGRQSPRTGLFH